MVVVGREHEAEPVERLGRLGGLEGDGEAPVRPLAHAGERRSAGRPRRRRVKTPSRSRRVGSPPSRAESASE